MEQKRGDVEKAPSEGEIMRQGNISLILDSYNDLFSDFDPRGYSERTLSDDFLVECKKASVDKKGELGLRFLIPTQKRNLADEEKIRKRLKAYFQKHHKRKEDEQKKMRKEGALWFFLGAIMILLATLLYTQEGFLFNLLFVLFEPAGWFTIWNGLDKIFITPREKLPDLEFYKKMAKVKIQFYSY